ncbi:MAG: hypothetical protein QMC65_04240 [Candidatus Poseidoniaceae archaeon]|jgi:hypothetical protein|tara:strand:+ start:93 stop:1874 length:1782 start_codon:yes stop_codon:yes gene_type:complete
MPKHGAYVSHNMADPLKDIMLKITDDNPATRGQKLWVMFALSLFLVATLNWYAMVREPQVVDIEDLVQHKNEVVLVEGTVISWIEDRYGNGEDRVDLVIEDETGVIQVRWYSTGTIPPIGTNVTAMGNVVDYNGRFYMQATGSGAMYWELSDLPDIERVSISDLAVSPETYVGQIVTVNGFISEAVNPDATFTSAYITDASHQMQLLVQSATGVWIESDSKIEVTGMIVYQEMSLRWALMTQGPTILIDRSHMPQINQLEWSGESTWSYESGSMVSMAGTVLITNGQWTLSGPNGNVVCILPTDEDRTNAEPQNYNGSSYEATGRLMWNDDRSMWCIDANNGNGTNLIDPMSAMSMQAMLSANPASMLQDPGKQYTLSTFMQYSFEPLDTDGYFVDSQTYTFGQTRVAMSFPSTRTEWIEAGQGLIANVTVSWDDQKMMMRLMVDTYQLVGDPPGPQTLLWDAGATQWGYTKNQYVLIDGKAALHDDGWYLERPGSEQSIKLNIRLNAIGTDSLHENQSLTWNGRLRQIEHPSDLALVFSLDDADAWDTDGDRLADSFEDATGFNSNTPDSDGDGINDREEMENGTGPNSGNS